MLAKRSIRLAAYAAFAPLCGGFGVASSNDGNVIANALFNGAGVTVLSGSSSFTGGVNSSGVFTGGLGGIGSGAIFTSGNVAGALPGGNVNVNNYGGSSIYCGSGAQNSAVLSVNINLSVGYDAVQLQFILASADTINPDPIGIYLDSQLYSVDTSGNLITAASSFLAQPIGITPPNSVTSYNMSSPPLLLPIFTTPGTHTMVFAICDASNANFDSALMIRAAGCAGNACASQLKINYVTVTSIVAAGQEYTSTVKASGTVSGTPNKFNNITKFNPINFGPAEPIKFTSGYSVLVSHTEFNLHERRTTPDHHIVSHDIQYARAIIIS
ncbi:hypothetical protein CkaCkLH20_09479 [Colletotrichum karsti]|uniref:Uncharacterized protein n=1 Tax=Colletotrichum karsti TaxID=1095194 RepID=A0A9P6LEB0_9PEZI|nr:uncharacterized protein CkaCkLH20_09479 [Colletotrichum karsti]KAF9872969.1 hypothetical protein CkaCkLH20_09479 [Colletotrichum karsti]